MIKWLKKNWMITLFIFIVSMMFWDRACKDSNYKKDIKKSDDKILTLEKKNEKLENVVFESAETAKKWEKRSEEKEDLIKARELEINQLKEDLKKVPGIILELPPSELVAKTREILDCAQIELTDQGIVFSENCARAALIELTKFSLVKNQVSMIEQSMIDCQDALTFQKLATWNVYRVAWAQGSQILNYKTIGDEKDLKFSLCQKQKKKAWLDGLWKGFLIGAGATIIFSLVKGLL